MSVSPTEINPDDPIVELPMEIRCSVCKTLIRDDIAHWPLSHVKMAERNSKWTGVVISHSYCDKHTPTAPDFTAEE